MIEGIIAMKHYQIDQRVFQNVQTLIKGKLKRKAPPSCRAAAKHTFIESIFYLHRFWPLQKVGKCPLRPWLSNTISYPQD